MKRFYHYTAGRGTVNTQMGSRLHPSSTKEAQIRAQIDPGSAPQRVVEIYPKVY